MAITFALYYDAARTQPVTQLALAGINDALASPIQQRLYVGPAAGIRTLSTDGNAITLSVTATGDVPVTACKLALTQAGLETAVAGDALALPAQLDDLAAFWLQIDCSALTAGEHAGLSITSSAVKEVSL